MLSGQDDKVSKMQQPETEGIKYGLGKNKKQPYHYFKRTSMVNVEFVIDSIEILKFLSNFE